MSLPRYTVQYFVNNKMTATLEHCTAEQAYKEAVPGEATQPYEGNRWHVLLRYAALPRLANLDPGEAVPVAWQDPSPHNPTYYDVERIIIVREPEM